VWSPRSKIASKYNIVSDYEQWKAGRWVHYGRQPFLKINPQQFHQDPAGIYLFPEDFRTMGSWHYFPYKFFVQLDPSLKVLDLADYKTKESCEELYKKLKSEPGKSWNAYSNEKTERHIDLLWEDLKTRHSPGSFTKLLLSAGFDAVFDDTNSIFSGETQLIVLNLKKLGKITRQDKKGFGFALVRSVADELKAALEKFGTVTEKRPKTEFSGWDKSFVTSMKVYVEHPTDVKSHGGKKTATFEIRTNPGAGSDPKVARPVDKITVETLWSKGKGFHRSSDTRDFNFKDWLPDIVEAVERLFGES